MELQKVAPKRASGSSIQQILDLVKYLLFEGGLIRSPVLAFAILSSMSRAALIFSINHAATNPGLHAGPILMLAGSVAATLVFSHLARVHKHAVVEQLQRDMRLDLSRRLLSADVSFLQQKDHGHIYAVVTQETGKVATSALRIIEMFEALLLLMICAPYLFWLSWLTGVATLMMVAIGAFAFTMTDTPARQLVWHANRASAGFFDRIDDMLGGWMELRLRRSRRDALERHATSLAEQVRSNSVEAERLFSLGEGVLQASLITLLCVIVVGLPLIQGSGTPVMFQVLTLVLFTYGPIELVFSSLPKLSRAVASKRMVDEVIRELAEGREVGRLANPHAIRQAFRSIELRGVTAVLSESNIKHEPGQREDTFELGPIDLTLRPGETVFICGGNGSGKSTLMGLVTGLRFPDSGEILLDGKPVDVDNIGEYRSLFSAVFSHFHLFHQPYGLADDEVAVLASLIEDFGLGERVKLIESGFSTLSLSTGQKRRLALAVALAEARPIIVLDEFAADQDPGRRAFFYDTLVPQMARDGHLVIVVTHDEHRFEQCDRLIKMEAGRIVSETRMPSGSRGDTLRQVAAG